jgi:hypothetical protein
MIGALLAILVAGAQAPSPPNGPTTLDQRKLETLPAAEVLSLALQQLAPRYREFQQLIPHPLPGPGTLVFYQVPRAVQAGLCGVGTLSVELANDLPEAYEGILVSGAPFRAESLRLGARYRVIGPLEARDASGDRRPAWERSDAECRALPSAKTFFEAPDLNAAVVAVERLQAVRRAALAAESLPFELRCSDTLERCSEAREVLRRLRDDDISGVSTCSATDERGAVLPCHSVGFRTPTGPLGERWGVYLMGADRVSAVTLQRAPPPVS